MHTTQCTLVLYSSYYSSSTEDVHSISMFQKLDRKMFVIQQKLSSVCNGERQKSLHIARYNF